jgi:hypothetical protein
MTGNKRHALAHDYALQVPLSDEAEAALRGVVEAHLDAFDAALEPFGLTMADVLLPTWMRAVYVEDVVPFAGPHLRADPWARYARAELTYDEAMQLGGPLDEPTPEERPVGVLKREPGVPMGEQVERSLPLLSDDSARCAGGGCAGCRADDEARDDGKLSPAAAVAMGLVDVEPTPDVDLLGALRSSVDRARAFQAEADRDGYGR